MANFLVILLFSLSAYSQNKPAPVTPTNVPNQIQQPLRNIVFDLDVKKPTIPNDIKVAKELAKKYCKDYTNALTKHLVETLAPLKMKPDEEIFTDFCKVANEIIDRQISPQSLAAGLTSTQDRADFMASAEIIKSVPALIQSYGQQATTIANLQGKISKTSQDLQISLQKLNGQQSSKSVFESLGVNEKSVPLVESILILVTLLISLGLLIARFMQ